MPLKCLLAGTLSGADARLVFGGRDVVMDSLSLYRAYAPVVSNVQALLDDRVDSTDRSAGQPTAQLIHNIALSPPPSHLCQISVKYYTNTSSKLNPVFLQNLERSLDHVELMTAMYVYSLIVIVALQNTYYNRIHKIIYNTEKIIIELLLCLDLNDCSDEHWDI